MTQPELVSRARGGDADAIAALIGHSLAAKGITARAEWQGDDLQILLEGDPIPPAHTLIPNLRQGFERLAISRPLSSIRLYARRSGHDFPDWAEAFTPTELFPPPAPKPPLEASPPPASLPASPITSYLSDTALVALAHLSPLLGYLVFLGSGWVGLPFFMTGSFLLPWRVLPPLALLLTKGKESKLIESHTREALNFQLSLTLYWLSTIMLMLVLVGFLLVIPLAFFEVVCTIVAAVKASEGKSFRYPLTIRFIR